MGKIAVGAIVLALIAGATAVALTQIHQQQVEVAGQIGLSRESTASIQSLLDEQGLVRMPELEGRDTPESLIDATFMAISMAYPRAQEVMTSKTAHSLYRYASDGGRPTEMRLKAYAALRGLGDTRWKEGMPLVRGIERSMPESVDRDGLAQYMAAAEPIALLDTAFSPTTRLEPFDTEGDESGERLAVSAMILRYLFSNSAQIPGYFTTLQPALCQWAGGEGRYIQQRLFAVNAVQGTAQASCISDDAVRSLYGCRDSPTFISTDGSPGSPCSLTLTYAAWRTGLWK